MNVIEWTSFERLLQVPFTAVGQPIWKKTLPLDVGILH